MGTSAPPLPDTTIHDLHALLEAWLASRPGRGLRAGNGALSPSSAQLYRDMWAVFAHHLVAQRHRTRRRDGSIDLAALDTGDLRKFLDHTAAENTGWTDRYAWRMLHLIDRVLAFHQPKSVITGQTPAAALLAEPRYRHANAAHHDTPPEILTDSEVERLIGHLDRASVGPTATTSPTLWKPVRDAAVVATMLGAGLGPADAQALTLDGIALHGGPTADIPWQLTVPADGVSPQHQTPILPWAGTVLARWLAVRKHRGVPGASVFPSILKGATLSRMSCHRLVVGVLERAGIAGGVPLRLRHTFAVQQLSLGHDEETVGRWLGLVESKAIRRYVPLAAATPSSELSRTAINPAEIDAP